MHRDRSILRRWGFVLFATLTRLWAGCGGEPSAPTPAEPSRQELSWEEFLTRVYREPETGIYVANGDEPFADLARLREFYDTRIRQGATGQQRDGLAIMFRNGVQVRWDDATKRNLTYCVNSPAFGSRYATVVAAMASAARAWEAAADVRFVHLSAFDSSCTANQAGVLFDVNPVYGTGYLARAFFPDDARAIRNVLIDGAAFGPQNPPTLTLVGMLRHELGHVLGFRHERTRPEAGSVSCFEDWQWEALTSYDADSVMHYPQCNGQGDGSFVLTERDIQGTRALYGASPTPILSHGAVVAFRTLGNLPGARWLDGRTEDGTVGLVDNTNYSGARWRVHSFGDGTYAFETLGHLPGPRWLDGRTYNGTVGLIDSTAYTGTRWRAYAMGDGIFAFETLGHLAGPRWLDGRTHNSTVGLIDSTAYTGTRWQVVPH